MLVTPRIALTATLAPFGLPLLAGVCHGGRPLVIDDAAPVDAGRWQVEAGVGFRKQGSTWHLDSPVTLAHGLLPRLEVGLAWGGQLERRGGAEPEVLGDALDLSASAKWCFLHDEPRGLALTALPTLKLPVADGDRGFGTGGIDYDLTLIATQAFGRLAVDLNLGYTLAEDPAEREWDGLWHYGVALRRDVGAGWWVVGEVFAATPVEGPPTVVGSNVGFQREIAPGLVLDAAVGTGLHEGPDFTATVGFTWAF